MKCLQMYMMKSMKRYPLLNLNRATSEKTAKEETEKYAAEQEASDKVVIALIKKIGTVTIL